VKGQTNVFSDITTECRGDIPGYVEITAQNIKRNDYLQQL